MPESSSPITASTNDERTRLAALERYDILDTAPEQGFDDIARLAAQFCGTPVGLITFVDDKRQFFKARIGFQGDANSPLDAGFCPIVVRQGKPAIIPDTAVDPEYEHNVAVREGGVRFYAGVPLLTPDNQTLGTLCVLDTAPRADGLTSQQRQALEILSREVMTQLELRRETEEHKMSEARLLSALSIAQLGTYDWDAVSGEVIFDARSREIFGLPATVPVQQEDVFGRIAPEDIERVSAAAYAGFESGAPVDINYSVVRPDGYRSAVRSFGDAVDDGNGARRMRGVFQDITDLQRAEDVLRASHDQLDQQVKIRTREFDRAWRLSQELLVIASPDGTLTAVNPLWTDILGWFEHELIGTKFVDYTHPDDLEATLAAFAGIFDHPLAVPYEYRFRHKDGSYRWFAWTGTFEDGKVYASGRDIAVEREQADALRQSQKMEAVGQLTGGLAHDFNNLLAGISGSLELMQTRMQQGRYSDVERYMAAAQGASRRAAALTHRLLAFSRRQTLDPKPTDVNKLVTGMHEMIQRTVGPSIPIEVVGAAGLWPVLVDPPQLENALLNLCINARDAMPDGGRITVETANKWLDERAARQHDIPEGQYLSLCVTDTGTGMSPELIAHVFEPFFTTKPIGEGTGLGLSMIYGFAKQSGGQVRIYSEVGEGTTVCVYLPRHYGDADAGLMAVPLGGLPQSKENATVLIVDDEPAIRMIVSDILEETGYTTIEAGDSAAGLKILQSSTRIDLLVTDVGLPGGMNGRQMAEAGRVKRPGLKVLFITGYAENAIIGNGQLEPGMAVLTKPFPMEAMATRIRSMLEADKDT